MLFVLEDNGEELSKPANQFTYGSAPVKAHGDVDLQRPAHLDLTLRTWLTGVTSPKVEYAHLIRWEEVIRHGDREKESQTHAGSVCAKMSRREGALFDHCSFQTFSARAVILELSGLLELHSDNIFQQNGNVPKPLSDLF